MAVFAGRVKSKRTLETENVIENGNEQQIIGCPYIKYLSSG